MLKKNMLSVDTGSDNDSELDQKHIYENYNLKTMEN